MFNYLAITQQIGFISNQIVASIGSGTNNKLSLPFFIIIIIFILIAIPLTYYFIRKSKTNSEPPPVDKEGEIKKEIINKLKEIENRIYFEYLSYSIYNEANRQRLDDQSISELKKEYPDYGRYLSYPVIDWNREFDFLGINFYLLNPTIQEHLNRNGYKVDPEIILPNNFNNYLRAKARKEAEAIVTKYLYNKKEGENYV